MQKPPRPEGAGAAVIIDSELIQNIVMSDVKQQDQSFPVVFPNHPHIHVHAELKQVRCPLDALGPQRRIQGVLHQKFQLFLQLAALVGVQLLQIFQKSFGVCDFV